MAVVCNKGNRRDIIPGSKNKSGKAESSRVCSLTIVKMQHPQRPLESALAVFNFLTYSPRHINFDHQKKNHEKVNHH